MSTDELFAAVFVVGMFTGVFIIYLGLRQRSAQLEMLHRERMAMIERGQVPLADPADLRYRPGTPESSRSMSVGIIVIGMGLALMTIVSIAGESPQAGVGVGGAIVILGAAFIVRSMMVRPEPSSTLARRPPSSSDGPSPLA